MIRRRGSTWIGLALALLAGLMLLPVDVHAARTVTSATVNGAPSVTVTPSASITAVVNVTTTGTGTASRWRSTGWLVSTTPPGTITCVDHANFDSAGSYNTTFTITAPATAGTYNAYFIAYSNDTCSAGASATFTLPNAVVVMNNPVPTTTSISPSSKQVGDATFDMTVNGTNFVAGSVVRFNGANRTTTYASATQLTVSIPATDLLVVGTYPITVFNPTPGGGTSNAQTFTVNPGPPVAATNAATGVTVSQATLNGTINTRGANTTIVFQYGLTTSYGESIAAAPSPVAAGAGPYPNVAVSATLDGLNCNTLFHYRVVATNSAGTTNGLDGTFTTGTCVAPYPATACAATRYGTNLGCTAADVSLTSIKLAPGSISSCVSGTPVALDLDLIVNFSSPDRYDVGIFIANDGKLPTLLTSSGGAGSCSVDVLPIPPGSPFLDLDGVPQGTADTCGDGNSSIDDSAFPGGTPQLGDGVKRMTGVTLPCYASAASGGKLFVPFTISWNSQKSPSGTLCTSNLDPVPSTAAKCNAPPSTVSVEVVVLPVISKSNGTTTINPGANTTYAVTITNNSGGTLLDSVFQDPAVTDLTVNSVGCSAAGGASCPATSVAAMQGAGIAIPSANLPNDSSLTFTINATLSPSATVGANLVNTATVTTGTYTASASDTDLIEVSPSAAKSFSPATITEGASSVLTITLTNPAAAAITGVAFTDTYPSGLVNIASPGATSSCGGTVTAAGNGNSVALSGGTIPALGSCTVTVDVTSATAAIYVNSTGAVTSDAGPISAVSATLTVDVPVVGRFNACDTAAAPNTNCTNVTTATTSRITTKIAGSPFTLDLVALNTNGTRNTSYNNSVIVELQDANDNSGTLDGNNCRSSWTTIATLSPNPAFVGANNGLITVGPFTIPGAYREVRVRVTNAGGSSRTGCSTDNFAIRPYVLVVSATDADWETTGVARTLNVTDAAGTPVHKAGRPFTVTATAVNLSSVTTTNYPGSGIVGPTNPTITLGACAGTACIPSLGILTPGATTVGAGVITWNNASYSEAGSFKLSLEETGFTAVDAADTAASCAGRYVCGEVSVGRFVPDHFVLATSGIVNRSDINAGLGCAPASTFTYMGEPMKVGFTLTAMNSVGGPTQNYGAVHAASPRFTNSTASWTVDAASDRMWLWMVGQNYVSGAQTCSKVLITNATPSVTSFVCLPGTLPNVVRTAGPRVTISTAPSSPGMSWSNAVGTFGAHAVLERADVPDGPYGTVNIGVAPVDIDGVTVLPAALDLDANAAAGNERVSLGTTISRFGRLRAFNAYGSELLELPLAVETQYWNGVAFVPHALDTCTTFAATDFALDFPVDPKNNLSACETSVSLTGGSLPTLKFSKPGTGNNGWVDLVANLGTSASGTTCIAGSPVPATTANKAYLQGAWSGTVFNQDPPLRATFGTHRAKFIYFREKY